MSAEKMPRGCWVPWCRATIDVNCVNIFGELWGRRDLSHIHPKMPPTYAEHTLRTIIRWWKWNWYRGQADGRRLRGWVSRSLRSRS